MGDRERLAASLFDAQGALEGGLASIADSLVGYIGLVADTGELPEGVTEQVAKRQAERAFDAAWLAFCDGLAAARKLNAFECEHRMLGHDFD